MILRRLTQNLRAQNWTAIGIEFLIVVVGVFIGTQVANWNQARLEKQATARLITELGPALKSFLDFFETSKTYYATTRAYADKAFDGWRQDPGISDEQFVIAAYQASQIYTFGLNGSSWANVFGADHLREIDDVQMRRGLSVLMTNNYDSIEAPLATQYREQVRQVIPEDIQDAIRTRCGDHPIPDLPLAIELSPTCDLDFPPARFAAAASALRARPNLVGDLRWHRAVIATFLSNLQPMESQTRLVLARVQADNR